MLSKRNRTRNSPNGYVPTACDTQEMELNTQTKYCSAKHEKVKVSVTVDGSEQDATWPMRVGSFNSLNALMFEKRS